MEPLAFRSKSDADAFIRTNKTALARRVARLYALRHSPSSGYVFRELLEPELPWAQTGPRLASFCGQYGETYWHLEQHGLTLVERSLNGRFVDERSGGKTNNFHFNNKRMATEVLRLGMFDVKTETVRPENVAELGATPFTAILESGAVTRGQFFTETNSSEISRIEYSPASDGSKRVISLTYSESIVDFPKDIKVERIDKTGVRADYCSFEVLSINRSRMELPVASFRPEQFMLKGEPVFVVTGTDTYQLIGTNRVSIRSDKNTKPRIPNETFFFLFVAATTISTIFMGFLIWSRNTKTKPNKTYES